MTESVRRVLADRLNSGIQLTAMEYSNEMIDGLLQPFIPVLGNDLGKYRNHVYRVFLNCQLLDDSPANQEKYAIAAVFHDIGIWTNSTIDYLEPSVKQAGIYLNESKKQDWTDEISLMINWHHKLGRYHGRHEKMVENFRKADWIDVSLGLMRFGLPRAEIKSNRRNIPNGGFHLFLIKKIIKNFARHPLNPLPMFRK